MHTDNFWKIFWSLIAVFVLAFAGTVYAFLYVSRPGDAERAAVGVLYNQSQDPFQKELEATQAATLADGYLYRESLPLGFEDWSWSVVTNWHSRDISFDGNYSFRVDFLEPWAGVRINRPNISVAPYHTISLSIYPTSDVGNLYIELHDTYGQSFGKQLLSWYSLAGSLKLGQWNTITIPLENLIPSFKERGDKQITGFSISAEKAGAMYVDAVRLEQRTFAYPRWENPVFSATGDSLDKLVDADPAPLPYHLSYDDKGATGWRPLFGLFSKVDGGIHIGPIHGKTQGSMAIFTGGRDWKNYRADTVVYWGLTSTFSILARFADDGNFASCAFSHYGSVVQIYVVKDGVSEMVSQTPLLAINYFEPWRDAKHGAAVEGNTLACYVDGQRVLSAELDGVPDKGTVGVETWSINSDDYPHVLESFTVTPI